MSSDQYNRLHYGERGGTESYWKGQSSLAASGKDEMLGHPGALGGGGQRKYRTNNKAKKDSFKKKRQKEYIMTKAARGLTRFATGTVAGPSEVVKNMKKMKSGPTMPKIHSASAHKPISGSASAANMGKTASSFKDEILSLI